MDGIRGRYGCSYVSEFRQLIERFAPAASRFLEWGSGETTEVLCDLAKDRPNPFVLSIDDQDSYLRAVADSVPSYNFLHFRKLDLQGPSFSQEDKGPSYSSYPFFVGLEFDVAVIDGRRRAECALTAAHVVSRNGIVIVHDWRRSRYATIRTLFETLLEGDQFLVLRPKSIEVSSRSTDSSTKRKAVIVVARGKRALNELRFTLPFTKSYAAAIGADCVVVGRDSSLPVHRLKFEAAAVAREYDRALLLDADVIIRAGSPDVFGIVPEHMFGAFPEGLYFRREDWCREVNDLYDLGGNLIPEDYFNSGVMVFSQANLHLLESLKDEPLWAHPQFEQGFLNAKRVMFNIPLLPLPPDFNYIPDGKVFPIDWRFSFFLHFAGSGKKKYIYHEIWYDEFGDRTTFTRHRFASAHVRAGLLRQASEQLQGKDVIVFDASDFFYKNGYARLLLEQGCDGVVAFFPPRRGNEQLTLSVSGPYATLEAGHWRGEFLTLEGVGFVYDGAAYDIVKECGDAFVVQPSSWPSDGVFEFHLAEKTENIEFRIYRAGPSAKFAFLRLERLDRVL